MLSFLGARAIPGGETVAEDSYRRTISIKIGETLHCGWISVSNQSSKNVLSVTLAPTLLPVLSQVLAGVSHLFDINCIPEKVCEKLVTMNDLGPNTCVPGMRLPGCSDPPFWGSR